MRERKQGNAPAWVLSHKRRTYYGRMHSFSSERKYTQEQLSEVLPGHVEVEEEEQHGTEKGLNIVCAECDFIKHCTDNAKELSEHDWYAMITNLAVFAGGNEAYP